jgi:hypothetical protein
MTHAFGKDARQSSVFCACRILYFLLPAAGLAYVTAGDA